MQNSQVPCANYSSAGCKTDLNRVQTYINPLYTLLCSWPTSYPKVHNVFSFSVKSNNINLKMFLIVLSVIRKYSLLKWQCSWSVRSRHISLSWVSWPHVLLCSFTRLRVDRIDTHLFIVVAYVIAVWERFQILPFRILWRHFSLGVFELLQMLDDLMFDLIRPFLRFK